jgi:nucleotide-binding universal stress UspA family protein
MSQQLKYKVLIALDGSEAAERAVRYVANLTRGSRHFEFTLFHVVGMPASVLHHEASQVASTVPRHQQEFDEKMHAWLELEKQRAERDVFAPARRILASGDEDESRLRVKELAEAHPDVALAILEEAGRGDYDTVVLGRKGHSYLKEFMFGSVSWKVIHHLERRTVWVVA